MIHSVSWDCGEGTIRIAVNDGARRPDVTVLSSAGQVAASISETQDLPGRTVYEAPLGDDSIFSIRAVSIDGRAASTASETLRTDGACSGERAFERYAGAAAAAAPAVGGAKAQPAQQGAVTESGPGLAASADASSPPASSAPADASSPPASSAPAAPAGEPPVAPPAPPPAEFEIEEGRDASYYVGQYADDEAYRGWFDGSYPQYRDICEAVGADPGCVDEHRRLQAGSERAAADDAPPECGEGMVERDGKCVEAAGEPSDGGAGLEAAAADDDSGCLIATAAFGTELAPQVQALREVRDGTLLSTRAGSEFVAAFGGAYYAFSPHVADLEREIPALRQAVALALAPMLHALQVVSLAEPGSEAEVIAYGAAAIALAAGMYAAPPAAAAAVVARRRRGR